jgi:hypothetical protein
VTLAEEVLAEAGVVGEEEEPHTARVARATGLGELVAHRCARGLDMVAAVAS